MKAKNVRSVMKYVKREVFANVHVFKKIQKIVDIITKRLSVDVCSIYILNKDNKFELYATEGLSKEAINKTIIDFDEGLVGQVALAKKTMHFENIWNNEHFSYRPETAEDPYYTFIGTPIIAHDNLLGILVIQNKSSNLHEDYHADVIEMTSIFLSRLFLNTIFYPTFNDNDVEGEIEFRIDFLSKGKAVGKIILHTNYLFKYFGENAIDDCSIIDDIEKKIVPSFSDNDLGYFNLFQEQFNWLETVKKYIKNGLLINAAFFRVFEELSFFLDSNIMKIAFLKRITDFFMIEAFNLSLNNIRNDNFLSSEDFILVADNITPYIFFYYVNSGAKGFIISKLNKYSIITSIAKSLNIPIITGVENINNSFKNGEYVILDANNSSLRISSNRKFYENNRFINYEQPDFFINKQNNFEIKKYNDDVKIYASITTVNDFDKCKSFKNFSGVGIFRQEVFFGNLGYIPNAVVQGKYYREIFSKIDNDNLFIDFFHFNAEVLNHKMNKYDKYHTLGSILENRTIINNYLKPMAYAANGKKLGLFVAENVSEDILKFYKIIKEDNNNKIFNIIPSLSAQSTIVDINFIYKTFDYISIDINVLIENFYPSNILPNCKKYNCLTLPFLKLLRWMVIINSDRNKRCIITSTSGVDDPLLFLILQLLGFKDIFLSLQFNRTEYNDLFEKRDNIEKMLQKCFEENIYDVKNYIISQI